MRKGAALRLAMAAGVACALGAGCASLAGIEDLQFTGTDGSADATGEGASGSGSGGSSGGDAGSEGGGPCKTGQVQCSANGVQTCDGGTWTAPEACTGQTCVNGACTGVCSPGQTNPVPCGNCGTSTQTCSASGTWADAGCSGQGPCKPGETAACSTYGMQSCSASCTWETCSCPPSPTCMPGAQSCSGANVETCDPCGQWGAPTPCPSGTCMGAGVCQGACTAGQTQCSGNSAQQCVGGMWGAAMPCTGQTCDGGMCVGACAPGQTNPVPCGNCGTDTQTCDSSGNWQNGTCTGQGTCSPGTTQPCATNPNGTQKCSNGCSWGACTCSGGAVCTPGATQCSAGNLQTCNSCGQWGNPTACPTGMTCSGTSCVTPATDCPGGFLVCDGFESGPPVDMTRWPRQVASGGPTMAVDTVHPHSGAYSLHIHAGAVSSGYPQVFLGLPDSFFPIPTMYVRAWFALTALPGQDGNALFTFASSVNMSSGTAQLGFDNDDFLVSGVAGTVANYYTKRPMTAAMPYGGSVSGDAAAIPWTCLEMAIDVSYQSPWPIGHLQVWQDVSSASSQVSGLEGTAQLQQLNGFTIGISYPTPTGPFDLFIDDIAIDSSYIPCDQ